MAQVDVTLPRTYGDRTLEGQRHGKLPMPTALPQSGHKHALRPQAEKLPR